MFYVQQVEQQGLILHQLGHGPPGCSLDCFDENAVLHSLLIDLVSVLLTSFFNFHIVSLVELLDDSPHIDILASVITIWILNWVKVLPCLVHDASEIVLILVHLVFGFVHHLIDLLILVSSILRII